MKCNEYYFGTELVVCPITEPTDKAAGTACVKAWIPEVNGMISLAD